MATTAQTAPSVVHQTIQDACLWRRSGAIAPAQHDFQARRPGPSPARLRMPVKDLKCCHMRSGLVAYKLCAHGFDCVRCAFDQMLEDAGMLPTFAAPDEDTVAGVAGAGDRGRRWSH